MATLESNHEILLRLIGQIFYFRQVYIRRWGIFLFMIMKDCRVALVVTFDMIHICKFSSKVI